MSDVTKVPSLPSLNGISDPQTRTFLAAVKELLEVRDGRRGQKLDRFVTLRELGDAEVVSATKTGSDGKLIVEAGGGGLDYSTPPALTNLAVTGGYAQIFLSWDDPQYSSFSYAEVWRSATDALGTADWIGETGASVYSDSCGTDKAFYYWVRAVNKAGVKGPFNAVNGVPGQTTQDLSYIMEQLTGLLGDQPFYAVTETQVVNGVTITPGVYIKDAKIGNGSITNAKIGNAAIDDAKIANLSAVKITAGTIAAARLDSNVVTSKALYSDAGVLKTAVIKDAHIETLNATKINAGTISAARIGAGSITADKINVASLDALSATIGVLRTAATGARLEIRDNVIKVYDASGVVRVQLGNLAL